MYEEGTRKNKVTQNRLHSSELHPQDFEKKKIQQLRTHKQLGIGGARL